MSIRDPDFQYLETRYGFWTEDVNDKMAPYFASCSPTSIVDQVKCSGRNCHTIKLHCVELPNDYRTVSSSISYTEWFSEEKRALVTCPSGKALWGIGCRNRFCDNIILACISLFETSIRSSQGGSLTLARRVGGASETIKASTGTKSGCSSFAPSAVYRAGCNGFQCREKILYYSPLFNPMFTDTFYWTDWFQSGGERTCIGNSLISQLQCEGLFCRRVRIRCTRVSDEFQIGILDRTWSEFECSPERYAIGYQCVTGASFCKRQALLCVLVYSTF